MSHPARQYWIWTIGLFGTIVLCGCDRNLVTTLETQLRQQEDQIFRLQQRLETQQEELAAVEQEAVVLRTQLADRGKAVLVKEQSQTLFRVEGVKFHPMLTGVLDRDGKQVLNVVLFPHDADGDVLKLPGALELELIDLSRPEADRILAAWRLPEENASKAWQRGPFGSGFTLRQPLPRVGDTDKILLHAKLIVRDGREFDATHTIEVEPEPEPAEPVIATRPNAGTVVPASAEEPAPADLEEPGLIIRPRSEPANP